jgi:hypothetical protein
MHERVCVCVFVCVCVCVDPNVLRKMTETTNEGDYQCSTHKFGSCLHRECVFVCMNVYEHTNKGDRGEVRHVLLCYRSVHYGTEPTLFFPLQTHTHTHSQSHTHDIQEYMHACISRQIDRRHRAGHDRMPISLPTFCSFTGSSSTEHLKTFTSVPTLSLSVIDRPVPEVCVCVCVWCLCVWCLCLCLCLRLCLCLCLCVRARIRTYIHACTRTRSVLSHH